ncbi:hypothetical protein GGE07_006540 [Sinorhizobium terangae]|nr:hypothetical protein [Sinorhizobium terangae]
MLLNHGALCPTATAAALSVHQLSTLFRLRRKQAFALHLLAGNLALAAHRLGFLARSLNRGLFKSLAHPHFPKNALALEFLLQDAERLIDIVIAY